MDNQTLKKIISQPGSFLVTGAAGTGKSTFVREFAKNYKGNYVLLAPTGMAAVNIGGQTIHSFFSFRPDTTVDNVLAASKRAQAKIYNQLECIIIDEVSMVRADLLDCVDIFLRAKRKSNEPFGGVRLIMVGDLMQLPPILQDQDQAAYYANYKSVYFFDAKVFGSLPMKVLRLNKIYRQTDIDFIEFLNKIRHDTLSQDELDSFNNKVCPMDYEEADQAIMLTSTNYAADKINNYKLTQLEGEYFASPARVSGNFRDKNSPAPLELKLKKHARVMLLHNDPAKRYHNGSLGYVYSIDKKNESVEVKLDDGTTVDVEQHTWEEYRYQLNEADGTISAKSVGSLMQYPLKPAWAVTIHKAQGQSFDSVAIDFGRGAFAHGQAYVALSRARTLNGVRLLRPLTSADIICDEKIIEFEKSIA